MSVDPNEEVPQTPQNPEDLPESSTSLAEEIDKLAEESEPETPESEEEEESQEPETPESEEEPEPPALTPEQVDAFLKANGYTAFRNEDLEQANKTPEVEPEDDSAEMEYLHETNFPEWQRRITERSAKDFQETQDVREQMIADIRKAVDELDDADMAVIRKQLGTAPLSTLKAIQKSGEHLNTARAYGYAKIKAGVAQPVAKAKVPPKDNKVTARPDRVSAPPAKTNTADAEKAAKIAAGLARITGGKIEGNDLMGQGSK